MHVKKLKVRPRKGEFVFPQTLNRESDGIFSFVAQFFIACAGPMSAMLSCFSATKDFQATGACASAATNLHKCMQKTVSYMFDLRYRKLTKYCTSS